MTPIINPGQNGTDMLLCTHTPTSTQEIEHVHAGSEN